MDEKSELIKMVATPGWGFFEDYLKKQIRNSKSITCINTSSDDEIIKSFKLAQSRVSVYSTILDWVKKRTSPQEMEEKKNG